MALLLLAQNLGSAAATVPEDSTASIKPVIGELSNFWSQQFAQLGGRYPPPSWSPFSGQISGVCDQKQPLGGSFYCTADEHLYIDFQSQRGVAVRAQRDAVLAQDFALAHLIAHQVQYLIGTTRMVEQARASSTPENANHTLITFELQADCYAGLWLHSASQRGVLAVTPARLAAALSAIAAEAKARAQTLSPGVLVPDPMDSGTAAQRLHWARLGLESGKFEDCDTFGAAARGEL